MTRTIQVVIAASLSMLAVAPTARAQTDAELDAARATFAEGVELTEAEQWSEAAERFRAVLAVRSTPQVQFNLGLALSHTDRLAEAARHLGDAIADPELDRRTRRHAERILRDLEPRLARLTVRLAGDEGGVEVTLDDEPLGLDRIGQPIPVDPGSHRVVASRGGAVMASETVTLAEGAEEEVTLEAAARPIELDVELAPTIEDEPAEGGGDVTSEAWFWAVIGGAALLVVGAIVIGIVVAEDGNVSPFSGNLSPGYLEVTP